MAIAIKVEYKKASEDLQEVGRRGTDMRPVFDRLIDALATGEQALFEKSPWRKNSKQTIARKINQHLDPRPMRATGALERMLTRRGAPGQIARGGGRYLEFGARHKGANIAAFNKNPKYRRVTVKTDARTRNSLRDVLLEHIVGGLNA